MNPQQMSEEIITELERDKIIAFCKDKLMFEAVKKYTLAVCYKQGVIEKGKEHNPTVNWAMNLAWGATNQNGIPRNDEELGQNLRAMTYAVQLIGSGFKEMSEIKKPTEELKEETVNNAE